MNFASQSRKEVSTAKFQKKLVVFKYTGLDAVEKFTRADRRTAMRGLLPPIPLESTEDDMMLGVRYVKLYGVVQSLPNVAQMISSSLI